MNVIEALSHRPFVLYGAQVVAYGAYRAIAHLCGRKPEFFAVSSLDRNPSEIDGIPVRTADCIPASTLVMIAVTELLQEEIAAGLRAAGHENLFFLTHHEEHLLMSEYFHSIGVFPAAHQSGAPFETGDLVMYIVKNHRDVVLRGTPPMYDFEREIQAGAALTSQRLAGCTDNTGDHISWKNRQYCEMSAAYWVWKNTDHLWTGLEHYRRRLFVKPEMLRGADAILPLPYMCCPNAAAHLRRFISEDVLQALLRALQALHPAEYEDYRKILYGPYQYAYNLFCARKEVFREYCAWFFAITEYMEKMDVPEIQNTRALSYVAEALTSLYFLYYRDRWNVLHVEKGIFT